MKPIWYISFADDTHFFGGVFVEALTCEEADQRCRELGIRPDAQFLGAVVPHHWHIPVDSMNRLLSKATLTELFPAFGFTTVGDRKLNKNCHVRD